MHKGKLLVNRILAGVLSLALLSGGVGGGFFSITAEAGRNNEVMLQSEEAITSNEILLLSGEKEEEQTLQQVVAAPPEEELLKQKEITDYYQQILGELPINELPENQQQVVRGELEVMAEETGEDISFCYDLGE